MSMMQNSALNMVKQGKTPAAQVWVRRAGEVMHQMVMFLKQNII